MDVRPGRRLVFAGLLLAFTAYALVASCRAIAGARQGVQPRGDFLGDYMRTYAPVLARLPERVAVCWFCDVDLGLADDWVEGVFEGYRAQYALHPHRVTRFGEPSAGTLEWYVGRVGDPKTALAALRPLPLELVAEADGGVLLLRRRGP
jgi:hypothetical protein